MKTITEFTGVFAFLSNFHLCGVKYERILYPSSEHAYQAAKAINPYARAQIATCRTPGQAKRAGQKVTKKRNWDQMKIDVMHKIVLDKFTRNVRLRELLLATGDRSMVEGNTWHDTFWGTCNGVGQNHLGRILMEVRKEIK